MSDPGPAGVASSVAVTADGGVDRQSAELIGSRYLIKFEEDTLRHRPLWIRLIIEFVGTFILVTVAAGAGVINHYAGGRADQPDGGGDRPRGRGHGHDLRPRARCRACTSIRR